MGIITGICIGVGVLTAAGIVTRLHKGRKQFTDKLDRIIREVDSPKEEKPEETETADDMNLASVEAVVEEMDLAADDISGAAEEATSETEEEFYGGPDDIHEMTEEQKQRYEAAQKRLEELEQKRKEREEEERMERIKDAIEREDVDTLYREFERKYAYAPIGMTPSEAFGHAKQDGLIDQDLYDKAYKRFERLWCYAGD